MESSKALDSDYTAGNREVVLTSGALEATYEVKVQKTIRITGTDAVGDLKMYLSLDPTIDNACLEMSKRYERFSIDSASLWVQTASPLGTSSGGFQLAHIADPENANLPATAVRNADKAVRQQGSSFIRPRDSVAFPIPLQGMLYTKQNGSPRWWSFGALVGVVRAVPDATDYVEFTCTFTATFKFMRTAEIDEGTEVAFAAVVENHKVEEGRLILELSAPIPGSYGFGTLMRPGASLITVRNARGDMRIHKRIAKLRFTFDGKIAKSNRRDIVEWYTPLKNSTITMKIPRAFHVQ